MNSNPCNFDGFVGDFRELMIQFVQMKRSLGFDYVTEAKALKRFSKFTLHYSIKDHALTKELVDAWVQKRPNEQDRTWEHRINDVRQFALFLSNLGYDAYIPACRAKVNRNLFVPHIFTVEQIHRIFVECDTIKFHPLSNRNLVFPAIYRLLYGCGLRISEALALKQKDVDLTQGIITIRNAKFKKDRLSPLSPSVIRYLEAYSLKIHPFCIASDFFFKKKDQTAYAADTMAKNFRHILWKCKISHGGKGRGPRLHDLRHTFAVHSLNQMVQQGMDIYCALPILSTYLGHASVAATEKYVRLTEEAYPGILGAVNLTCSYVFPAVKIK